MQQRQPSPHRLSRCSIDGWPNAGKRQRQTWRQCDRARAERFVLFSASRRRDRAEPAWSSEKGRADRKTQSGSEEAGVICRTAWPDGWARQVPPRDEATRGGCSASMLGPPHVGGPKRKGMAANHSASGRSRRTQKPWDCSLMCAEEFRLLRIHPSRAQAPSCFRICNERVSHVGHISSGNVTVPMRYWTSFMGVSSLFDFTFPRSSRCKFDWRATSPP